MLTNSRFCGEGSVDPSADCAVTAMTSVAVVFSATVKMEPLKDRKSTFGLAEKSGWSKRLHSMIVW